MASSKLTATLLASDPAAFRDELLRNSAGIDGAYPPDVRVHAKVIAGMYGLMIAACMWALVARGQRGKLWFISRNKLGILRPNSVVLVQLLVAFYCVLSIVLILLNTREHAQTETLHLVVFTPLSLAGWIQVYGTLSAIPRQGMANASGAERRTVYRSRLTRLLESALLRTLLLVVIPCLYIILLLVPAIRAGVYQRRTFSLAVDVLTRLESAVAQGGWQSLAEVTDCGRVALLLNESYMGLRHSVQWACSILMVWVTLDLMLYIIASVAVWRTLNRQVSQLKRTLANADTLRRLSVAPLQDTSYPASIDSHKELFPPAPSGPKISREEARYEAGASSSSAPSVGELADLRSKMERLRRFRRVFAYQAVATVYIELIAIAYSSFGIANGFFSLDNDTLRELPLFVPIYAFVLPAALPSSLINTWYFIHHNDPLAPSPPPATPEVAPSESGDFAPPSSSAVGGEAWKVQLRRGEERREDEKSGAGTASGSGGSGSWAVGSGSAEGPGGGMGEGRGRPSEWARAARGVQSVSLESVRDVIGTR